MNQSTYLVIHNNHSAGEKVMVSYYTSEPLGGRVLSVDPHSIAV